MAVDIVFTEAKKGYNKDEVQSFIKQLVADHELALMSKDDAIKSLMNDKESAEQKHLEEVESLKAALEEAQKESKEQGAKYEELCARMGEKLLFAERQSAQIVAEAEAAKKKVEEEAAATAAANVAAISAKAREDAAAALRAADILKQKSQQICAGLDHTRRAIEEAIAAIERAAENA